jgi:6-pyruvoyltetrahydropterin/6-carboxytetrahydropterin synthase
LSAERNRQIYGKCNNPYGHGHDYILEVSVLGPVDQETGMAVRVAALDGLVREQVLESFHMRNLNLDVPEFADVVPTSENVALVVQSRLQVAWNRWFDSSWPVLEKVRIQETPRNTFEVHARAAKSDGRELVQELASK